MSVSPEVAEREGCSDQAQYEASSLNRAEGGGAPCGEGGSAAVEASRMEEVKVKVKLSEKKKLKVKAELGEVQHQSLDLTGDRQLKGEH